MPVADPRTRTAPAQRRTYADAADAAPAESPLAGTAPPSRAASPSRRRRRAGRLATPRASEPVRRPSRVAAGAAPGSDAGRTPRSAPAHAAAQPSPLPPRRRRAVATLDAVEPPCGRRAGGRRSRPTSAAHRGRRRGRLHLNDLLMHVLDTRRAPTSTSRRAPARRSGCTASCSRSRTTRSSTPPVHPAGALRDPDPEAAGEVRGGPRARLRLHASPAGPGSASTSTGSATRSARRSASSRTRSSTLEDLGVPPSVAELRRAAARPRARHRPDRLGQVDDARVAHRPGQPHPRATTS